MATVTRTEISRPPFVADWESIIRDTGHTIDWAAVPETYRTSPGQVVTVGTGGAAAGDTTIPVVALTYAVPAGTLLDFTGTGEYARVSANAAAGAISLTVDALDAAVEEGDTATIAGTGGKFIPAGTRMGTGGTNGRIYPRVAGTNPAAMVLATNAREDGEYGTREAYGVFLGGALYDNLMPGSTGTPKVIPAAEKTELAAAGCYFTFLQYRDSTA